jgi:hypothetical protein
MALRSATVGVHRDSAEPESIVLVVIGNSYFASEGVTKLRLQAACADLLDDPCSVFRISDVVLMDADYGDCAETVRAVVIGRPRTGVVEVETRGEMFGRTKHVAVRLVVVGKKR